ncbi:hypothetical protein KI387_022345, partial [Taxus chinensis]
AMGEDIKTDLAEKSAILETQKVLSYQKGPRKMDIDKLKNCPIVKAAAHLSTKLNDQERWSQINSMWLHVAKRMSEGTTYNIIGFITKKIVEEAREG